MSVKEVGNFTAGIHRVSTSTVKPRTASEGPWPYDSMRVACVSVTFPTQYAPARFLRSSVRMVSNWSLS